MSKLDSLLVTCVCVRTSRTTSSGIPSRQGFGLVSSVLGHATHNCKSEGQLYATESRSHAVSQFVFSQFWPVGCRPRAQLRSLGSHFMDNDDVF